VTLAVTSDGANVTPSNLEPVVITIPAAVPTLTSAKMTKSGQALTLSIVGFSNTREVTQAVFHFTPVAGSSITNPDVTVDVAAIFAGWYASTASDAYGSAFTYMQPFTLDSDASSIAGVTVKLTNSVGGLGGASDAVAGPPRYQKARRTPSSERCLARARRCRSSPRDVRIVYPPNGKSYTAS
jgi:hypothetical protein